LREDVSSDNLPVESVVSVEPDVADNSCPLVPFSVDVVCPVMVSWLAHSGTPFPGTSRQLLSPLDSVVEISCLYVPVKVPEKPSVPPTAGMFVLALDAILRDALKPTCPEETLQL
jgi:hypothetical protein